MRERWILDDSSRIPENRMFLEVQGAFPFNRAFRWVTDNYKIHYFISGYHLIILTFD